MPLEFALGTWRELKRELTGAGAVAPSVEVLSAYKQGFLWLTERVFPALKGKGVASIKVAVAEYHPDFTKKYKFYQVPSRWLQELYPADEIAERELGVRKDRFTLELVDGAKDIYSVEALDAGGKVVERRTFSPMFVEREYLDKFPGWSRVDVTTGWLRAIGWFLPLTHALAVLRGALLVGAGPAALADSFLALIIFAGVLAPVGFGVFAFALRRARIDGSLSHY